MFVFRFRWMALFSVLGWHTTKRFQYWVDIPQYVRRRMLTTKQCLRPNPVVTLATMDMPYGQIWSSCPILYEITSLELAHRVFCCTWEGGWHNNSRGESSVLILGGGRCVWGRRRGLEIAHWWHWGCTGSHCGPGMDATYGWHRPLIEITLDDIPWFFLPGKREKWGNLHTNRTITERFYK